MGVTTVDSNERTLLLPNNGNDDEEQQQQQPLNGTNGAAAAVNNEEDDHHLKQPPLSSPPSSTSPPLLLPLWNITCILSTAFSYGCIMTTLFIITLPVECDRIEQQHPNVPKSVALGCFVAIAGITQLISPLVGMLSDTYRPPTSWLLGQRLPYLCLGSVLSCIGLMGEYMESYNRLWLRYGVAFFCHMIGLNITYSMMIALIPDQVPHVQTGTANGILALLLVTGSLSGFGIFHMYFGGQRIQDMYGLYLCIVILTTILTALYAHDRDASLLAEHMKRQRQRKTSNPLFAVGDVGDNNNTDDSDISLGNSSITDGTKDNDDPLKGTSKNNMNNKSVNIDEELTMSHRRRLRRQKHRRLILGPFVLFRTMVYDPFKKLKGKDLAATYTIDVEKHHDFFIVTISRLCYYCGSSVQTFFLYFLHDIIRVTDNPESAVAALAVVSQISGALICYPVGLISDQFCGGRRKPFVYMACILLGGVTFSMIFARTLHQMTILCFILGLANGSYLTMETSLAVDTLPEDYEEGPSGGNAQLLGIWGVAAFLGSALGPMIGGPLLYFVGIPGAQNGQDYSIQGYAVVLSLSTAYFLCSALSLRWVRKKEV